MANATTKLFVAGLLVVLPVRATIPATAATLQVNLINAAGAPHEIVERAREIAARVFRAAGVEILWLDSCRADSEHPLSVKCSQPEGMLTVVINLDAPRRWSRNALGCALPLAGSGNHAGAFYSRIADLARDPVRGLGASEAEILGHVISHELGHLLLHTDMHSPDGLMKADWTPQDLYAMRHGNLSFRTLKRARCGEPVSGAKMRSRRNATEPPRVKALNAEFLLRISFPPKQQVSLSGKSPKAVPAG